MISFEKAYETVLSNTIDLGVVLLPLSKAHGRVLAEPIKADRDFPPFDRSTRDGIAIQLADGVNDSGYTIKGVAAAGTPQKTLETISDCFEIMTGAILPAHADTVIMYEDLEIENGVAKINQSVSKGQHIHYRGGDEAKGSMLLEPGTLLTAAEIGVLASVGKSEVLVKKNPRVTLFSTGDELVPVESTPEPHQIRQSNSYSLKAALWDEGISSEIMHVSDEKMAIAKALKEALEKSEVLLISGGVSKGKYDFLPEVLEELGVEKQFHRVLQRPGKPFWFGRQKEMGTTVFGFPGNPTSTFANYHIYFKAWLNKSLGRPSDTIEAPINKEFQNTTDLTRFIRTYITLENGTLMAQLVNGNGSGDLTSLTKANGFIRVAPHATVKKGEKVTFIPTRRIL